MAGKFFAFVGIALIVFVFLAMPMVSADINKCTSSDFELKIEEYDFFFEFSKQKEMPSLKYLICKYKEGVE